MTDEKMLAEVVSLPIPDLLEATSIDAPIGAGRYYNSETAIQLRMASRNAALEEAAKLCEALAKDELGNVGNQCFDCAAAIRNLIR
jgi:hypothetical protein